MVSENKLAELRDVAKLFRTSQRTIQRYEKAGLIPARLSITGRKGLWLWEDLINFVNSVRR